MKKITITTSPKLKTQLETEGFIGAACTKIVEVVKLGIETDREYKGEFYQGEGAYISQAD